MSVNEDPARERRPPQPSIVRRPHPQPRTLVDAAAAEIRARIVDGRLGVGEKLPSENALSRELGVSRTVMREAFSSLEALGLVETRTTRGRFVSDGSPRGSETLVQAWLRQRAVEIAEFDEVRAMVEAHVVSSLTEWQAFDAATRGRAIVDAQRAAVERNDGLGAAEADGEFHRLLASFTHNGTIRALAEALSEQMRRAAIAVYSLPESAQRSLAQHEAILEALAHGDRERAARLDVEHHLDTARRHAARRVAVAG